MQTTNLSNVWGTRTGSTPLSSPERFRHPSRTQEQTLFLHRFEVLLTKRHQHAGRLPPEDWRMRLIAKALYSTYRDCLELSVGDDAREILRRERAAPLG
ncbi:MAG: hypothetical protein ACRDIY_23000 [Chloroflexota bacterium]